MFIDPEELKRGRPGLGPPASFQDNPVTILADQKVTFDGQYCPVKN
jgi:hypothetical protein